MAEERIRRPALDRTQPIRSWSTLTGSRPGAGGADAGAAGPANDADGPGAKDAVAQTVELGYQVIDEYVQRGQRAAERMRRGTYGVDGLGEDMQDLAGRFVRYFSDFGSTWLELLERTGMSGPRPHVNGAAAGAASPDSVPRPAPAPMHIRIEVSTRRAAEVALDITATPVGSTLIVHSLRAPQGADGRIQDVAFLPGANGGGTIKVSIPDQCPSGSYSGLVLDADTNRPVGALTVVLRDP